MNKKEVETKEGQSAIRSKIKYYVSWREQDINFVRKRSRGFVPVNRFRNSNSSFGKVNERKSSKDKKRHSSLVEKNKFKK